MLNNFGDDWFVPLSINLRDKIRRFKTHFFFSSAKLNLVNYLGFVFVGNDEDVQMFKDKKKTFLCG